MEYKIFKTGSSLISVFENGHKGTIEGDFYRYEGNKVKITEDLKTGDIFVRSGEHLATDNERFDICFDTCHRDDYVKVTNPHTNHIDEYTIAEFEVLPDTDENKRIYNELVEGTIEERMMILTSLELAAEDETEKQDENSCETNIENNDDSIVDDCEYDDSFNDDVE